MGPVEIEETFDPRYFSGLPLVGPSAELIMPNGERCLLDSENKIVILVDSTGNMRTDAKTLIVESNEVVGID